jgi:6-phosphofructokinase 1
MGRNAGFLTAAAALAKEDEDDGPHLVYLPERTFTIDRFVEDVAACMKRYGRCVVAVSEGIRGEDGRAIAESFSNETDAHGNVQLTSGALGENLAHVIRERLQIKRVRADTFGFIQRCFVGITSESDATEAREVGTCAVNAATSGAYKSGTVAIVRAPGEAYTIRYEVVPLANVAKHTREVPDAYINDQGNNVTEAFLRYARPIVGALPPTARFSALRK